MAAENIAAQPGEIVELLLHPCGVSGEAFIMDDDRLRIPQQEWQQHCQLRREIRMGWF